MLSNLQINRSTLQMIRRIGYVLLLFAAAAVVISAVERKEASLAAEVVMDIEPLPAGERMIKEQDVRLAIERSFGYQFEGLPLSSIDVERLERVLEEEPFILDADAYISANNQVKIRIVQRKPILRIMDNNGLNYYLDGSGVKMPLSPHFTAKVIVATGNLPPHEPKFLERKRNNLKDAYLLANMILEDEFLNAMVEQIHFSNRGNITLIPLVGNHKIVFGPFEKAGQKMKRLKVFYKEALPYEGWNKYREVNLQYDGQVVCKKR